MPHVTVNQRGIDKWKLAFHRLGKKIAIAHIQKRMDDKVHGGKVFHIHESINYLNKLERCL